MSRPLTIRNARGARKEAVRRAYEETRLYRSDGACAGPLRRFEAAGLSQREVDDLLLCVDGCLYIRGVARAALFGLPPPYSGGAYDPAMRAVLTRWRKHTAQTEELYALGGIEAVLAVAFPAA